MIDKIAINETGKALGIVRDIVKELENASYHLDNSLDYLSSQVDHELYSRRSRHPYMVKHVIKNLAAA
jgi:hypothetical protein